MKKFILRLVYGAWRAACSAMRIVLISDSDLSPCLLKAKTAQLAADSPQGTLSSLYLSHRNYEALSPLVGELGALYRAYFDYTIHISVVQQNPLSHEEKEASPTIDARSSLARH